MIKELHLEQRSLIWFQENGWGYRHGSEIGPDSDMPECSDYRQIPLPSQLRVALFPKLLSGELSPNHVSVESLP